MKSLRTASTGRLLAAIAGVVAAIAAGTAIAVAASGSGPVPKREPLATALHNAATAPAVQGISARVSFTNNLIGAANFQGSTNDPLLQGTPTGRLWLSNDGRARLELQGTNGDAQVILNRSSFWISDPAQNTVYEGNLPSGGSGTKDRSKGDAGHGIPTVAQIQSYLNRLVAHMNVSGAIPGDVAGQPAYTVRISPRHDGGLLGSMQLAWDAVHGVPLRIAIYARNDTTPMLELTVTGIAYGPVSPSVFAMNPPAGAKVVHIASPAGGASAALRNGKRARTHHAQGVVAVQKAVPFPLIAPRRLIGLPRTGVQLLDMGGERGALVTYGQGLGGIAVIQRAQSAQTGASGSGSGIGGMSLPSVSINGVTAHELATPLGTLLTFERGGVSYTVLGSVPPAAAEMAARGL
jgi:outer membrane lipoprotein-sorting protein